MVRFPAKELGWSEVAATFVDVDPEQAKRILLVDNRTNDLAGYDTQVSSMEAPHLAGPPAVHT